MAKASEKAKSTSNEGTPIVKQPTVKCIRRAGSGLYGAVWEGEQGGRKVAVKVIHEEMRHVGNAMDHFKKLARVDSHANIVTVHSVEYVLLPGTKVPTEAVVMEWLEGETLGKRLSGPQFSIDEAVKICRSILSGLRYIHEQGVWHGDLHPGNVILTAEAIKIIDIDCSEPNSIAKLSLNSQEQAIQADVDQVRFLFRTVTAHSSIPLDDAIAMRDALQGASSLSEVSAIIEQQDRLAGQLESVGAEKRTAQIGRTEVDLASHISDCIDNSRFVSLRQRVMEQASGITERLIDPDFAPTAPVTREEFQLRVVKYEQITASFAGAIGTGAFYGNDSCGRVWIDVLDLLANCFEARGPKAGTNVWLELELYPAMLTFYAAGIGAMAAGQFSTLAEILTTPKLIDISGRRRLAAALAQGLVEQRSWWNDYMNEEKKFYTPLSMRIEHALRDSLKPLMPLDSNYKSAFDRFEGFFSLNEFHSGDHGKRGWGPFGNFIWRNRRGGEDVILELHKEANASGSNWKPLKAGFFDGDLEEFNKTAEGLVEFLGRVRNQLQIF